MRLLRTLEDITRIGYCSARQIALMTWESGAVLFFMKTLDAPGLVSADHPWATGDDAHAEGEKIWPAQIAYRSHRRIETQESDEEIVTRVGRFLASMVRRSAAHTPEIPQGPRRRMPHAVNYLHGAVHHNGLFMVFDDIPDVIEHLTDRRFRRTLKRLGRTEQREISLVLRSRKIDPEQYAYCIGCIRSVLPWFANGNGPTGKPVLWGNAAPYPVVNLIHGSWMQDMWKLWRHGDAHIARERFDPSRRIPTVAPSALRGRRDIVWLDRWFAWLMFLDVKSRGFRGQLAFTNRKVIEPQRLLEYREQGGYGRWVACHEVPNPFSKQKNKAAS